MPSASVPEQAKQAHATRDPHQWGWVEPTVWTERMLAALVNGVTEGKWYSLWDDDEVLPLQERIESITDDSDLEEVYNTERHLLYVACKRARDRLLVTGVDPASEFLDGITQPAAAA